MEEWRYLNEYVNKINLDYQRAIMLISAISAILLAVFSNEKDKIDPLVVMIIPPIILADIAYMGYQFRISAIVRGHLAVLERKINKEIGERVHLWNSILYDTFMVRNNKAGQWVMVPNFILVFILMVLCMVRSYHNFKINGIAIWILVAYWCVIIIISSFLVIPFLENETIRNEIKDERKVIKKYYRSLKDNKAYEKSSEFGKANISNAFYFREARKFGLLVLLFSTIIFCSLKLIFGHTGSIFSYFNNYLLLIGNVVFLPLFAIFGKYYIDSNSNSVAYDKSVSNILFTLVCVIVAFIKQIQWLITQKIDIVKLYQAGLIVVGVGVVVWIVSCSIVYFRWGERINLIYLALMWICGLGYLYSYLLTFQMEQKKYFAWITFLAVLFIVIPIISCFKIDNNVILYFYFPLVLGCIFLAAITFAFVYWGGQDHSLFKNIKEMLIEIKKFIGFLFMG